MAKLNSKVFFVLFLCVKCVFLREISHGGVKNLPSHISYGGVKGLPFTTHHGGVTHLPLTTHHGGVTHLPLTTHHGGVTHLPSHTTSQPPLTTTDIAEQEIDRNALVILDRDIRAAFNETFGLNAITVLNETLNDLSDVNKYSVLIHDYIFQSRNFIKISYELNQNANSIDDIDVSYAQKKQVAEELYQKINHNMNNTMSLMDSAQLLLLYIPNNLKSLNSSIVVVAENKIAEYQQEVQMYNGFIKKLQSIDHKAVEEAALMKTYTELEIQKMSILLKYFNDQKDWMEKQYAFLQEDTTKKLENIARMEALSDEFLLYLQTLDTQMNFSPLPIETKVKILKLMDFHMDKFYKESINLLRE